MEQTPKRNCHQPIYNSCLFFRSKLFQVFFCYQLILVLFAVLAFIIFFFQSFRVGVISLDVADRTTFRNGKQKSNLLRSPIISIKPLPILYFVPSPLISFSFPGARFHLPFLVSCFPSPFRYFSGILYVNLHSYQKKRKSLFYNLV